MPQLQFVHSRRGPGWDGWGSDEIAHLIDLEAKIPEGFEPHFRIALGQASVNVPAPLTAARLAFPEWEGFEEGGEGAPWRSRGRLRSSPSIRERSTRPSETVTMTPSVNGSPGASMTPSVC